jgi:peptidoglycan/LPS O-acetylase OafA/YrhL
MLGQKTAERHLGRNTSVLLDVVRFFAAAVVATTHLSTFVLSKPLLPGESANAAVCIFFVLSGFVIRFVTVTRETDATEYWIDRTSRIYSVVAPTLALTVLFESAAFLFNPAAYHGFAQHYVWTQVPAQLLTNVTFTSGYWGYGASPLSNLPFWSLTYECVYYVLYGLMRYTTRLRWFLVPAILLLAGPSIALLFIVWWMGVLLFEAYSLLSQTRRGSGIAALLPSQVYLSVSCFENRSLVFYKEPMSTGGEHRPRILRRQRRSAIGSFTALPCHGWIA